MLVSMRDICNIAEQNNMAVAAVNSASLEAVRAAVDVAEETGYPIIIQHAEVHESLVPIDVVAPLVTALAERSSAHICLNLDHCENLSYARRALELGFTGVMFDGSALSYERNVELSQYAAQMCADFGAGLECELGSMGSREGGDPDAGSTAEEAGAIYTDPDQAAEFVERTGCDSLAVAIGNQHGVYTSEPQLNFEVVKRVRDAVSVPLVLHGASGISDADIKTAISLGIAKINIHTELCQAAMVAVKENQDQPFLHLEREVRKAVKERALEKIKLFGSDGKAE